MSKKQQQPAPSTQQQDSLYDFYASAFSEEELGEIAKQLSEPQPSTELEVAILRILIRRVMEEIGTQNPVKALPLIRQGLDAIRRAMRTQQVTEREASQPLEEAFAAALREIGEELGIKDE
jgi:hypothetical protein